MQPSAQHTKQLFVHHWSMPLLCGAHILQEILNYLNLCKIGQLGGFMAVAGVLQQTLRPFHQVIAALILVFQPSKQDVSFFLYLFFMIFTINVHP